MSTVLLDNMFYNGKSESGSSGGFRAALIYPVKHIIQQHGAHMELTSEKGKGTKIEIEFSKSR